ncbi:hypothetical protein Tco_1456668, partial [Tanacetum coccineum]
DQNDDNTENENDDNDDNDDDGQDHEEEGSDLRVQTPSHYESTDDEESDEVTHGANVEGEELDEEEINEEDEANELYRDVNINLDGRDTETTDALRTIIQPTQEIEDTCHTPNGAWTKTRVRGRIGLVGISVFTGRDSRGVCGLEVVDDLIILEMILDESSKKLYDGLEIELNFCNYRSVLPISPSAYSWFLWCPLVLARVVVVLGVVVVVFVVVERIAVGVVEDVKIVLEVVVVLLGCVCLHSISAAKLSHPKNFQ